MSKKDTRKERSAKFKALSNTHPGGFSTSSRYSAHSNTTNENASDAVFEANMYEEKGKYIEAARNLLYAAKAISQTNPRQAARYATQAQKDYIKASQECLSRIKKAIDEKDNANFYPIQTEMTEKSAKYRIEATRAKDLARTLRHESARRKLKGIEQHVTATIFIAIGLIGIFFLSTNITGNAIGNMVINTSNILGAVLFFIGVIGAFFWIKKKK